MQSNASQVWRKGEVKKDMGAKLLVARGREIRIIEGIREREKKYRYLNIFNAYENICEAFYLNIDLFRLIVICLLWY
jgi:hypothetical protein